MTEHDGPLGLRAAKVIPGGVNSGQRRVPGLEELVVTATAGATFTDAQGAGLLDYHAAFGPPVLGHNDPDVDAAVAATMRPVARDLMGVGVTPLEIELAERLCALLPSLERVLLTETGSEATFHAIRLARAATGRRHIIKFQGCYHGWHDAVALQRHLACRARWDRRIRSRRASWPEVVEATIVCRFNDAADVERAHSPTKRGSRRSSSSRSRTTSAPSCPLPDFLERLRELASAARDGPDLRRGNHRLPALAGRLPVASPG